MGALKRIAISAGLLLAFGGCAQIPEGRYGVDRLRFEGMEAMDPQNLAACLATQERQWVSFDFGVASSSSCGEPPFDTNRLHLRLWRWPWTRWPAFDRTLWERDLERILRWYRARGFPDAEVVDVRIEPEGARESDLVEEEDACIEEGEEEGRRCRVRIYVVIDEGEPVIVRDVSVNGLEGLPEELAEDARDAVTVEVEDRFDEHDHEATKEAMRSALRAEGHCHAEVRGEARIHRSAKWAELEYWVRAGPICEFGEVIVEGAEDLDAERIEAAASIDEGDRFDSDALRDAQLAVFQLGAFATVEVEPEVSEGSDVVPVTIRISPARRNRFILGGGIQAGQTMISGDEEQAAASQWDLHLLARWENRDFLGGLRRLEIEDRPRLIFNREFPRVDPIGLNNIGNVLSMEFRQPGFLEPRLHMRITGSWDFGPDPYEAFPRHSIRSGIGFERRFWEGKILLGAGLHTAAYRLPPQVEETGDDDNRDWLVTYWQQSAELDLRNAPVKTRRGLYLRLRIQEAGFGLPGNWDYLRIAPEVRAYAPLPLGMVLAGRFRVGAMFVTPDFATLEMPAMGSNDLRLGPNIHRFRGGGPSSNRGFLGQRLGDGESGGRRMWEANVELRAPLTPNLWLATFADMGDVNRAERFRFDYLQLSVGAGLRYYTIVGPIRLDFGFRVPGAQVLASTDQRYIVLCEDDATGVDVACSDPEGHRGRIFGRVAGAVHITIGEAF